MRTIPRWTVRNLQEEVVVMNRDVKEKLEREEHVPGPKRVYITQKNWTNSGSLGEQTEGNHKVLEETGEHRGGCRDRRGRSLLDMEGTAEPQADATRKDRRV